MTTAKKSPEGHAPDSLRPNLSVAAPEAKGLYWAGLLEKCPTYQGLTVGGQSFPKWTEHVVPGSMFGQTQKTTRIPLRGNILRLTRRQVDIIAERLKSKILRVVGGRADESDPTKGFHGASTGELLYTEIDIPSQQDIEARERMGAPMRPFQPRPDDIPVADLIYLIPLDPNDSRERSATEAEPPPVSKTGIRYAEDLPQVVL